MIIYHHQTSNIIFKIINMHYLFPSKLHNYSTFSIKSSVVGFYHHRHVLMLPHLVNDFMTQGILKIYLS